MNITNDQIQSAINAAEAVSNPIAPASTPVTVTQETLVRLIEGAKQWIQIHG